MILQQLPALTTGTVIVFQISFDSLTGRYSNLFALLDGDERERANRFRFQEDRQVFAFTRASLRLILGAYLGIKPASIQFSYTSYGKPYLPAGSGAPGRIEFNVSHSGRFGLIAVARSAEVGVDIECFKQHVEFMDLTERFFSPMEYASLKNLPETQRMHAFYRCWTRKEAYIKALGRGLSQPLDSFDVSLHPEQSPEILRIENDCAKNWKMFDIPTENDYAAALATTQTIERIQIINFTEQIC